ncbi:unnamed protein product [Rhizophagus irregularis]|nr:unnamed protein product [Rhizophagus irregularis]
MYSEKYIKTYEDEGKSLALLVGSGKPRSLYELLCKTFGIYISLSAGNGSKNLGSQDMDISIHYNRNFTPKQWLLMQLLPIQISGEDFWIGISRIFRELRLEDQDGLINTFVKKFQTLIPKQEKLPIVIDESQVAINKHEKHFSTTIANGPLRPFFAILLQAVLRLSTEKLCLVLSGTGMSFYDNLTNHNNVPAIAKSDGATYKNFFSIHDGFYKCDEMSKFIQCFLPL